MKTKKRSKMPADLLVLRRVLQLLAPLQPEEKARVIHWLMMTLDHVYVNKVSAPSLESIEVPPTEVLQGKLV